MQAACSSYEPGASRPVTIPERDTTRRDLEAAQKGDIQAMERLLLPHEPMLRAVCRGVLGNSFADAEDAVQETFLRALRNLPRYRGDARLSTWLTRIAIHVCVDHKRKERPQVSWNDSLVTGVHASSETGVLDREFARQALQILSPQRRAAFLLSDVEGWTMREVGEALGWGVPRVKVELYRSRRALAAWAKRHEEQERNLERR